MSSAAIPCAAQIAVSPLIVETVPGVVTISNDGNLPARLELKLADFESRADGSVMILPFGTGPHTCGSDVVVTPEPARIAPHSQERVSLRIAPAGKTCWTLLLVEASLSERPGNAVGVKAYRIAPGETRSAGVVAITRALNALRLTVRNTGSAPLRPSGQLELRTEAGMVIATLPVPPFSVHPGDDRWVDLEIPDAVPAGRYVAITVLDIGGADLIAGEAVIDLLAPARR